MSDETKLVSFDEAKKLLEAAGVSMDKLPDGSTMFKDKLGRKFGFNKDGGMFAIDEENGKSVLLNRDGSISANLSEIKHVSIGDVTKLKSYRILRSGSTTVHSIETLSGSKIEFSFNENEKIESVSCPQGAKFQITKENVLVFCAID